MRAELQDRVFVRAIASFVCTIASRPCVWRLCVSVLRAPCWLSLHLFSRRACCAASCKHCSCQQSASKESPQFWVSFLVEAQTKPVVAESVNVLKRSLFLVRWLFFELPPINRLCLPLRSLSL